MIDGPLVFVDIDTQRDFLEPTGVLFIPGSEIILDNLARLTRFASEYNIPVIATACAHRPDDEELRDFPPHCLVGTPGQEPIKATARPESVILSPDAHLLSEPPLHLTIQKRRYDVFSHPAAGRIFELYSKENPTFVTYGVATEYCVKAAVSGLLDRGYRVAVIVDAIRAIEAAREPEILTEFANRGALLTLTGNICG
ncbi:MAG TPA: isochorismatase family cysteine hydrolase [Isosphaeraceae bacterium]|nr:isochorismatase family cysteine hydrolase [Isosphaeraceae bacterium]